MVMFIQVNVERAGAEGGDANEPDGGVQFTNVSRCGETLGGSAAVHFGDGKEENNRFAAGVCVN